MRLAVIFESSPFDRKGLFNAVHSRIRHLVASGECAVDVYCIHSRDNAFTRYVRKTPRVPFVDSVIVEGITYNIMWYRFSIIDHILFSKLHRRPVVFSRFLRKVLPHLYGYDAVIAHSFIGAVAACTAFQEYGTPYFVTWHGSDIHTHPWHNPQLLADTKTVMDNAACNFFVSRALKEHSDLISTSARKEILYNGVSEAFVRYDDVVREKVREKYGLSEDDKVVAFVGNIVQVKNVRSLAPIFDRIASGYSGKLKFWIVGDGKLRNDVERDFHGSEVRFFGNVSAELMPEIMNCIDVLVLPSFNEGLPLVCAEALSCGANVVGSCVGGIPEVIGENNVVPLGDGFVEGIAMRAIQMLNGRVTQRLPQAFDWNLTAAKELSILKS